jgi:hypothetical protein
MATHEEQTEIHRVHRWEHANAAARLAESVAADDEGKISWQTDTDEFYVLTDYSGPTWDGFGGGDTGEAGQSGFSFAYNFSSNLSAPPDAAGDIEFNNASLPSVTTIWIHDTDRNSVDLDAQLDDFGPGDRIKVQSEVDYDFATFEIVTNTDSGTYHTLTVTYVASSGGFADAEEVLVMPGYSGTGDQGDTGDKGDTGAAGGQGDTGTQGDTGVQGDTGDKGDTGDAGDTGTQGSSGGYSFAYDFDTGVAAPPGSGEIRFNNATIASVTTIWVHDTDRNSNDLDANLDQLANGDAIMILSEVDDDFASFDVTGNTDSGAYHTLTVTYVNSSGGFADAEDILLAPMFQTGAQGDTGVAGGQGDTGVTGAAGDKGDTGDQGDTGTGVGATGEIFLTAAGGWPSTTNGCAANAKNEYVTNDIDIYSLDFDQTTQEYAQWSVWMPADWNGGTITADFLWTAASGSGTVIFGLQGRSYANDEAIDQAWGTAQEATDTLLAADDIHVSPTTAAITLAGTPAASEFVQLRVYRDPATDTLNADAKLLGVKVFYTRS